jgi:rare lipoprotein A
LSDTSYETADRKTRRRLIDCAPPGRHAIGMRRIVLAILAAAYGLPAVSTAELARQTGKASFYADRFAWRTMANGEPMNPHSNVAASRTLPLGTKAIVTNLDNGRQALVEIKDRGPYVKGRIIDLSPRVARELGMVERGVVPVVVEPIATNAGRNGAAARR